MKGSERLILDKANRARLAGPIQTPIPYVPKGFPFLSLMAVGPIPGAVSEHPSEPFTEEERSRGRGCLPSSSLSRPGASSAARDQKFIHPGNRYWKKSSTEAVMMAARQSARTNALLREHGARHTGQVHTSLLCLAHEHANLPQPGQIPARLYF